MADSTPLLPQMAAAADDREIVFNGDTDALSPSSLYGRNYQTCTGLIFGYIGGRFESASIANGTVTATASNTNYVVAAQSNGAVSISTSNTNWNDSTNYIRLYLLTAGGSTITSYEDHRQAIGGSGGGGGGAAWGAITGTLSDQTDLQAALDLKQNRTPNVQTVTSAATVTPTFSNDAVKITAQGQALALINPSGTEIDMLGMVIRIKDDGTARAISYDTQYRAVDVTLPTTTVLGKTLYLAMIFNDEDTTWDVLAVGQEA